MMNYNVLTTGCNLMTSKQVTMQLLIKRTTFVAVLLLDTSQSTHRDADSSCCKSYDAYVSETTLQSICQCKQLKK